MTLGVDFQTKTLRLGDRDIKLSIWDVAGQERFGSFRDTFYRGARAVALVYDVSEPPSFYSLPRWRDEIRAIAPHAPMVLIANKVDLPGAVPTEEARRWAREQNMPFLETSAATGHNVEPLFKGLAHLAVNIME